jgi:DNA-binding LacI/PurR family transcriptional regulator
MLSPGARPATAKDVAELAGVARPTVSAVLNGAKSGTMVSEATRARILAAAAELRYRPNMAARTMKSGKSRQVGVLVRNNSRVAIHELGAHPLAYEFILGISEGLDEAGYMMSFVRLSDVDPDLHRQNSAFQGHLLDGIIVVSDVPAVADSRLETLVPHCVWLDSTVWHETNCIRRDEVHAGRLATQKLIELGYRDLVCLKRPSTMPQDGMHPHYSSHLRWQGIREAADAAGVSVEECCVDAKTTDEELAPIVSRLRPGTGVLAQEYYTAYRLTRYLLQVGKRPGLDFALACCEGSFTADSMQWNELSHVTFDRFTLGRKAARMMLQLLDNSTDPASDCGESACPSQAIKGEWYAGRTTRPRPPEE